MPAHARVVTGLAALAATLVFAVAAQGATGFSDPAALPRSLPGDGQFQGGEPSMAFDPSGDGHLYAVAPGSDGSLGVGFWGSADAGATWQYAKAIGSLTGGFDSDIDVGIDHTVYALDLEAASSAVCRSHDFGKTFEDGCESGAAQDQAGAEEDRQWLAHDPNDAKVLYFNYHDLTLEYPILEKSTDGGSSFTPCANLVDPAQTLFPASLVNTVVGKTAVAKDGNIYVPIAAPTPVQAATSGSPTPPYGQIVIAYHKGCNGDQFANKQVYGNDGASFANLFVSNVVGPDGALYVLASGKLNERDTYNTYVWVSRDGAQHFSGPYKVNPATLRANVMSAVAAGTKPGQVAVSWYGSSDASDPNNTKATWRYYAATSSDYGKTWTQFTVTPTVFHYGDICTVGILCTTGNRNLLDFSSIAVNPATGRYATVFPGDPFDDFAREKAGDTDPAAAYISCQGGCNMAKSGGSENVLGQSTGCHDRTAPVSAISRKRSHLSRHGILLRGIATDKGCGAGGRGQVARVTLAISRRVGKRCQWLGANDRFGRTTSCRRKTYVNAKGTAKWTYVRKLRLRRGIYAVVARSIDSVGNVERPVRGTRASARHNHNHYLFKVR
jgi:hypothetical protein